MKNKSQKILVLTALIVVLTGLWQATSLKWLGIPIFIVAVIDIVTFLKK